MRFCSLKVEGTAEGAAVSHRGEPFPSCSDSCTGHSNRNREVGYDRHGFASQYSERLQRDRGMFPDYSPIEEATAANVATTGRSNALPTYT